MPFLGAHIPELIAVVVLAVLFFGPKRLPELGSSIGKTIKEFQKGMHQVTEPVEQAVAPVRELKESVQESLRLSPPASRQHLPAHVASTDATTTEA